MKILAIETSTLTGSVALTDGEKLLGEITLSVSVQHSERLMPAIDQLLRDASILLSDIDLFVVAKGPGSFTGLRIGMAAAQGLALAHGKPVVGISTLEGLAMNGLYFSGLVVPVLNAFRGQVYRAIFRGDGRGTLERIQEDEAIGVDQFEKEKRSHSEPVLILGFGSTEPFFMIPRASNLAFLAMKNWDQNKTETLLTPSYLRSAG